MDPPVRDGGAPPYEADPRRWTILGILCLSLVLIVASVSSLNVAIPSIVRALDASQTEQLWILDSYALVFAGLLLPAGAIGDRYGRKGALLVGLGIFGSAAVAASFSDTAAAVIASRATMGIGAALVMPATLSIITIVFPPEERGKAIAIWAGFAGAGGAIGPLSSGFLLEHYWWGSVFFINVPIVALAFVAITFLVPTSRDDERRPLDPVGALLSIGGLGSLVFGIINGPEHGWSDPFTVAAFLSAVVLLIGFVRYEAGSRFPMLDPRLFRIRRFALGSLTITVGFMVMFGMFFLITLYLQFVQGNSALGAAVRTLPFAVTMIIVSPRGPLAVARFGARAVVTAGLLLQASGFVVMAQFTPDTPYVAVAGGLVLLATGLALFMPASTEAIVSSLPPSKAGVGSAVNDTTREVGGAIGIALLGSLLSIGYRDGVEPLVSNPAVPPQAAEFIHDSIGGAAAVAAQAPPAFRQEILDTAGRAYTDGMSVAFLVAALAGVVTAAIVNHYYPRRPLASAEEREEVIAP